LAIGIDKYLLLVFTQHCQSCIPALSMLRGFCGFMEVL